MWIIKPRRIRDFAAQHRPAESALERWLAIAASANWGSLADVRKTFRDADQVIVASGRTAVVFNIKGNGYRLITAIHYNRGKVFVLAFMTHAEYSKDAWKDVL